jgi:magnesium transporter
MGLSPGSLVFIGDKKTDEVQVRLIDYDGDKLNDNILGGIEEAFECLSPDTVSWININGLHDTSCIEAIGSLFSLHPLLLEDVLNTGQRPKLEEFENCIFIVVKMLRLVDGVVRSEQLSMVLGANYLLTFQEQPGDVFEPVRNRIRNGLGRIRTSRSDYLAYALLDTVADNYIRIVEQLGGQVEDLELEVLSDARPSVLLKINSFRRELSYLRKSMRPAREAAMKFSKLDSDLIRPATEPFLKDLNDIFIQASDAIDTYREMLSDELDIYNSTVSNKMNDIMKVLTIFAAIFIPLTFIAGVYGTNFEYLPELHYKYSYYIFLGSLVVVAIAMLLFFKRRRWL